MAEESIHTWKFALGDWVRHENFRDAGFVVVWREYRETPWTEREQYGLMDIAELDLDLHENKLVIEIGMVDDLTAYDEKDVH
jgi:hypothetical protein